MNCHVCNTENDSTRNYCSKCGANLKVLFSKEKDRIEKELNMEFLKTKRKSLAPFLAVLSIISSIFSIISVYILIVSGVCLISALVLFIAKKKKIDSEVKSTSIILLVIASIILLIMLALNKSNVFIPRDDNLHYISHFI